MRMNIYLPDDLAEQLKGYDDINVSGVCQAALRSEVSERVATAALAPKMKRVEVYTEARDADVAFVGHEVAWDGRNMYAYITKRGRLAIYDSDAQALYDWDSLDSLLNSEEGAYWSDSEPDLLGQVAKALGRKHVVQLDI